MVLTSGFNRVFQGPFPIFDPLYSTEYIFVFDITGNSPVFKQAIPVSNGSATSIPITQRVVSRT